MTGEQMRKLIKDIDDAIAGLDEIAPSGLSRDFALDQATAALIACQREFVEQEQALCELHEEDDE